MGSRTLDDQLRELHQMAARLQAAQSERPTWELIKPSGKPLPYSPAKSTRQKIRDFLDR